MGMDSLKGALQKAGGKLEEAGGVLSGSPSLKEAGREDQLKGEAREAWDQVKQAGDNLVEQARVAKLNAEARTAEVEENERRYHDVHSPDTTELRK